MTSSDKERIDQAAKEYASLLTHTNELTKEACWMDFKAGAEYENPIAWNAAIDEVVKVIDSLELLDYNDIMHAIQKLKK